MNPFVAIAREAGFETLADGLPRHIYDGVRRLDEREAGVPRRLGERMLRRLRYTLFDRVLRFPISHFRKVKQAEVATMIKDEVEPLGGFIGDAGLKSMIESIKDAVGEADVVFAGDCADQVSDEWPARPALGGVD